MKAFSSEDFRRDSTMFNGQVVEHLTSWLTINPYKGCSLNCAYCFRVRWHPSNKPQQIYNTEEALEKLIQHPDFVPNETPVSINNSSTDCLLPEVKRSTFKAIEIMESKKLTNPFALITKLKFNKSEIIFLSELKYVKIIIFISLSFIPKQIEPTPIVPRVKNLQILSKAKIPCVLYFRPIVKGWNDSSKVIKRALKIGQKYCEAICIGSLTVSSEIIEKLQNRNIDAKEFKNVNQIEMIREDIEKRVLDIHKEVNLDVPVFKHSSCAVSFILKYPNYNFLFRNPNKNCLGTCPTIQQHICKAKI